MNYIVHYARRFWKEEDAVTIVEMVIIVAVILIFLIPTLVELRTTEDQKLKELQEKISK
ncbi:MULTISPECIES: Flp family type IVb pilin [Brevibacillus]|uniref:Pilus assembly protein n=1 Tax=Brevibacillus laterosporus TaxID=1465 RepID=A0AAP8QC32_BRELA|nr:MULTISPECIES: pilus assembly protein [Brevibacillus]AYB40387.1 pilus assembly protein [Brevibacillus laterosporus]MBG9772365.1 pilus assembly protein [Brevibacillus laterosporus]MBG9797591.1 pilus assembly protein [Brevibacillus laterosporus]MCG7319064.1 pilus assembly protein [Brevibacillus laterosporus]MCR8938563.1 pilus assembly protein [Brevibacillus laterosporus]